MLTHTDSIVLIWKVAAAEAAALKQEFIEKEHLFIALFKTHEFLQGDYRKHLGQEFSVDILKEELSPILSALEKSHVNPKYLRRRIRALLGEGGFERSEGAMIHRSEECKEYFNKAEKAAELERNPFLYPVHLFKALLLDPGPHIEKALRDLKTSPGDILAVLTEKPGHRKKEGEVPVRIPVEPPQALPATPILNRYCRDLTTQAREGKVKSLIGRENELLQVVRTLLLREKNNPVLVGEAGVGKTAIVEGLAKRIVSGDVPPDLQGRRIMELSLPCLVSGTRYRGEFEEKILGVIDEAKKHREIIIFIDEIHTMMGAGGAEGDLLDASNIMKPMLARGEISVIGATTTEDYRRYIEKDRALERRFQPIIIEETDRDETLKILEGLKEIYEKWYGVQILSDTLNEVVDLSVRYIPNRRLPDKAVDLMDKACVWVKVPALNNHVEVNGTDSDEMGKKIKGFKPPPLIVDSDVVAEVVSKETGIPLGRVKEDEGNRLLRLAETLRARVIGQEEAVEKVTQAVKLARTGLKDSRKPVGVFLFIGPTGVGKTELSKALAEALLGSEDEMTRLDMSEYMEKHSVSKLIGAPPGYVGYEEGGQFSEKLRRKPYCVVLLDEIEKAHPDVFDLFLQVFDEGRLTDAKGRTVDARNTIFIMTSNIGTNFYSREPVGFIEPGTENGKGIKEEITNKLRQVFRPEFLNRIDEVIFFHPLKLEDVKKIASKLLNILKEQLRSKGIHTMVRDEVLEFLSKKGYEPISGARSLARVIRRMVEIPLSGKILAGELKKGQKVEVGVSGDELTFFQTYDTDP